MTTDFGTILLKKAYVSPRSSKVGRDITARTQTNKIASSTRNTPRCYLSVAWQKSREPITTATSRKNLKRGRGRLPTPMREPVGNEMDLDSWQKWPRSIVAAAGTWHCEAIERNASGRASGALPAGKQQAQRTRRNEEETRGHVTTVRRRSRRE